MEEFVYVGYCERCKRNHVEKRYRKGLEILCSWCKCPLVEFEVYWIGPECKLYNVDKLEG